jgi:hypothetical protein
MTATAACGLRTDSVTNMVRLAVAGVFDALETLD